MDIDFSAFSRKLHLNHHDNGIASEPQIKSLAFRYESGKLTTDEFFDSLDKFFGKKFSRQQLLDAWNAIVVGEKKEMVPIVAQVQKQFRTAILSNTNETHFHYAASIVPLIQKIPLRFLSYEIGAVKPDPRVYTHVINTLNTEPASLLFIDDIPENITAARNAGMNGIIFQSPVQLHDELKTVLF